MSEYLEKLIYYFEFPFVRYAVIVGILIALCSSLLGVTLVLKRLSFIGDGLSHVAFGAIAIATILKISSNMFLVAPVTVVCAILLLRSGRKAKIRGDAALAMLSVGALAIGYLLLNVFSTSSNLSGDVCTVLFGSTSILTLSPVDVWTCLGISVLVIAAFLLCYNKIFAVTFDENFATATGIKSEQYNMIIAIITALVIVLAMNLVGALLTSALIIFPAISSMRIYNSFKSVIISSAIVGVFCATIGLLISILAGTPVGATIVVVNILIFLMFSLLGLVRRGKI